MYLKRFRTGICLLSFVLRIPSSIRIGAGQFVKGSCKGLILPKSSLQKNKDTSSVLRCMAVMKGSGNVSVLSVSMMENKEKDLERFLLHEALHSMKQRTIQGAWFLWTSEKSSAGHLYLKNGFKTYRTFHVMVKELAD